MSSLSHSQISGRDAESLRNPPGEPVVMAFAPESDGLISAEQLPPAADVLAQIFPPEQKSATDLSNGEPHSALPLPIDSRAETDASSPHLFSFSGSSTERPERGAFGRDVSSRKFAGIVARAMNLFGGRKSGKQKSESFDAGRYRILVLEAESGLPEMSPRCEANTHAGNLVSGITASRAVSEDVNSVNLSSEIAADAFAAGNGDAALSRAGGAATNNAELFRSVPLLQSNSETENGSAGSFAAKPNPEEDMDVSDDDNAIAAAIERYASRTDPAHCIAPAPMSAAGTPADDPSWKNPNEVPEMQSNSRANFPRSEIMDSIAPSRVPAAKSGEQSADGPASEISFVPSDRDWSFEEKLASHLEWVQSRGTAGKKADLAGAELEGTELIGVNLRFADLHDANLRAADLLMADLRDACLVRTNFRDACLVGANLEAANLESALLDSAMGLVPRQLAGANLHEASLPPQIAEFEARVEFARTARAVNSFFVAMMSASVLSWALLWTTKDVQLLTNSSVLPFLHSPGASGALPAGQIYLVAPFALFILYLIFHFQLQHLWDLTLELPAVFPDGRSLDENKPRIVAGLLRNHFRWMSPEAPSERTIEKAISVSVAYWLVPVTLLLFWLRYLTLQEIHGTILQALLAAAATGVALHSTTKVGRPAERWILQENFAERIAGKIRDINPVKAGLVYLILLTFLSGGVMAGVPRGKDRAPQYMAGSIRRWAAIALWSVGIDPYANLTEAVISTPPPNWNGSDDQVSAVKGARLNESNFRYAQAYRIFLANAHLWHADFQGAFLPQADFRRADLGQSRFGLAILDQARMNHANLDRSVLDGANLSRADLRAANLSYASLEGADLMDARLDGATLYGARLGFATLVRTNFEKADLREAYLAGANLEHADLQGAYLWSAKLPGAHLNNAQLESAILVDADLSGADLRWAQLSGTILTGADLAGASLDGADLRGAVGFGANQVCSAKSRQGVLLDPAMQEQVTAQCGAR